MPPHPPNNLYHADIARPASTTVAVSKMARAKPPAPPPSQKLNCHRCNTISKATPGSLTTPCDIDDRDLAGPCNNCIIYNQRAPNRHHNCGVDATKDQIAARRAFKLPTPPPQPKAKVKSAPPKPAAKVVPMINLPLKPSVGAPTGPAMRREPPHMFNANRPSLFDQHNSYLGSNKTGVFDPLNSGITPVLAYPHLTLIPTHVSGQPYQTSAPLPIAPPIGRFGEKKPLNYGDELKGTVAKHARVTRELEKLRKICKKVVMGIKKASEVGGATGHKGGKAQVKKAAELEAGADAVHVVDDAAASSYKSTPAASNGSDARAHVKTKDESSLSAPAMEVAKGATAPADQIEPDSTDDTTESTPSTSITKKRMHTEADDQTGAVSKKCKLMGSLANIPCIKDSLEEGEITTS